MGGVDGIGVRVWVWVTVDERQGRRLCVLLSNDTLPVLGHRCPDTSSSSFWLPSAWYIRQPLYLSLCTVISFVHLPFVHKIFSVFPVLIFRSATYCTSVPVCQCMYVRRAFSLCSLFALVFYIQFMLRCVYFRSLSFFPVCTSDFYLLILPCSSVLFFSLFIQSRLQDVSTWRWIQSGFNFTVFRVVILGVSRPSGTSYSCHVSLWGISAIF